MTELTSSHDNMVVDGFLCVCSVEEQIPHFIQGQNA